MVQRANVVLSANVLPDVGASEREREPIVACTHVRDRTRNANERVQGYASMIKRPSVCVRV